jgi:bacteriorhodopsin
MQFPESFLPMARDVGLLPMVVELFLIVAQFSFLGGVLFFLARGNSVHPAHRASNALSAAVCLVASFAYWSIHTYYRDMMHGLAVAITHDAAEKRILVHDAFYAIGQYRYALWAVATPLLLLKMVLILKVKPREIAGWIALLLGGDVWMVLAGSIGDQQFSATDGTLLIGWHLIWGLLAVVGYAALPYVLLCRLGPKYGGEADDESGHAFRLMSRATVTVWLVYPLGYLLPVVWRRADMNWVHLAYTCADLVNFLGIGAVTYMAGADELARRVPPEAVQSARVVT